jgi:carboxyl-terminal processing protease
MKFCAIAQRLLLSTGLILALQGCGGSGGSGGSGDPQPVAGPGYFDAPFVSASELAGQCSDTRQKQFIRSHLDEVYLWPDLVQRRNAFDYDTPADYFKAILTPPPLDRFSFSSPSDDADAQEGAQAFDVGIYWVNAGTTEVPLWRIARVEPNSPAATAGLRRGDTLYGRIRTNLYTDTAQALFYDFGYFRNGQFFQANLQPAAIFEDPVGTVIQIRQDTRNIAYIGFESHYANAQDQLIDAFRQMARQGVTDLVLDLRYNNGGYLYIASTLASMLTPSRTSAMQPVFVRLQPNAKQADIYQNAVLRMSPNVQYAADNARFQQGSVLPQLRLQSVYILTTEVTCSASESLINGLRGVGVTVHTIGNTTCGKPYGMSRQDNCGRAYYPIEFRGVNARGESDFSNGFAPTCTVADDLDHPRGDPQEAQLNAALTHMQTGVCPVSVFTAARSAATVQMSPRSMTSNDSPPQRRRPGMSLFAWPN